MIIEKLSIWNKIDLFYKIYWWMTSSYWKQNNKIKKLKERLDKINTMRNNICHANRQTLTENNQLRTKIVFDTDNWNIKFKNIEMRPILIKKAITEINNLINDITKYKDKLF